MKHTAWFLLLALACAPGLSAQNQSEEEFFGSTGVEAAPGTAEKKNLQEEVEKPGVGLSGNLFATASYTMSRDFVLGNAGSADNTLANVVTGDFLVDARLTRGFRAFLDLGLGYASAGTPLVHNFTVVSPPAVPGPLVLVENQNMLFGMKEIFVDFNFGNVARFRLGQQVLQWGVGNFWQPTDLINIEHKSFLNLDALLQGVFGLRADFIFSHAFRIYTFLNLNNIADLSKAAFAARAEFLAGVVEFGVAGWLKYQQIPVFGVDLSTPLFWDLNLTGEASFSWGDNGQKLDTSGVPYSVRDQLVAKVDVGLSRSFDAGNVLDRINVIAEFFYNQTGYSQNMFQQLSGIPLATFVGSYYHAGYYGQYYGALFVTVNKFPASNMTLSLSGLANVSDLSGIAMAMLSYAPVNNFTLSLQLGAYLGAGTGEYTISYNPATNTLGNNALFAILGAKVVF